jgi:hypothetical protein
MITTILPVSYRRDRSFKILFPAFVAKCVSKLLQSKLVLSIDLLGNRGPRAMHEYPEIIQSYHTKLQSIGIHTSNNIFSNADPIFYEYVKKQISHDINRSTVRRQSENVIHCGCGKIELPSKAFLEAVSHQDRLQLLTNQPNGFHECKFCNSQLTTDTVDILVRQYEQSIGMYRVTPSSYERRVLATISEITQHPLFISRKFRTSYGAIDLDGEILDPDYYWSHYICFLAEKYGEDEFVLVCGIDCLVQACKVLILTKSINPSIKLNLCIHPKIQIRDSEGVFGHKTSTDYLEYCGNSNAAQIFFSLGIQWNRFDSIISTSELPIIHKSLQYIDEKNYSANNTVFCLEDIMFWLKRDTILKILKVLRQRSELSPEQKFILRAIIK